MLVHGRGFQRSKPESQCLHLVRRIGGNSVRPLIGFFMVGLLLAGACTGTREKNEEPYTRAYTGAPIEFYDLNKFDRELSGALRGKAERVTVMFPAAVSLNAIPERLNRWLSEIESKGGQVVVIREGDDSASRGIISEVIGLIVTAVRYARDAVIFGPAADYNAEVHYDPITGNVTRVVFTLKPPEVEGS
jgi:hypothetical protein